jgi:zinc transport system permease protein
MDILTVMGYSFMQRALVAGSCIAVACALLGVFLVLKRFSLIGDGLAHVTFGTVALGLLLRVSPLYVSIPVVVASSLGILRLTQKGSLFGDTAIGIVSASGMAIGIFLASVAGGFNVDLFDYLFGNILTISFREVVIAGVLCAVIIGTIRLFYHELVSVSFDEEYAATTGIKAGQMNKILIVLTAITVVLAMKIVGVLLVSSLLIFPAATSLQVARSFHRALAVASGVGIFSVVAGILVSFFLNLPSGATIVLVNLVLFTAALLGKRIIP